MDFDSVEDLVNALSLDYPDVDPDIIKNIASDIYFGIVSYDDGVSELDGSI